MLTKVLIAIACLLGAFSLPAAQQNHYFLGMYGINAVPNPKEGMLYTNQYRLYKPSQLKDKNGHSILLPEDEKKGSFNWDLNIFSYYSEDRLFGAMVGTTCILPFIDQTTEFTFFFRSLEKTEADLRLGDVYIEPLSLVWSLNRLNLLIAYGVYMPTGEFTTFNRNNCGLGNWGHQFTLATTYFYDRYRTLSFSAYATYEFHTKKKGSKSKRKIDYHPGQNLCIDWGIGKVVTSYLTVGIVGYAEWQVTRDRGVYVPAFVKESKDRVFSIGPELDFLFREFYESKWIFRYEKEFGAHARTQGSLFITSFSLVF